MLDNLLTQAELQLGDAIEKGETFGSALGPPMEIRAEALRRMLFGLPVGRIGGSETRVIYRHPVGIRLRNVKVIGSLVLDDAVASDGGLLPPLVFDGCVFPNRISMRRARFRHLSFAGSRLIHLRGSELRVASHLDLSGVRSSEDPDATTGADGRGLCWIELRGVQVDGSVVLSKACLVSPAARDEKSLTSARQIYALDLRAAAISKELIIWPEFEALGGVNIRSSTIGGDIIGFGARLTAVEGFALTAAGARLGGSVLLAVWLGEEGPRPSVTRGGISFLDAVIKGSFDLRGASTDGLDARNTTIESRFLLGAWIAANRIIQFSSSGGIFLDVSNIAGDVEFTASHTSNVSIRNAQVGGSIFFNAWAMESESYRFQASGDVILSGIRVIGNFDASGAIVDSMNFDNAQIGGAVFLRAWTVKEPAWPFQARDTLSLMGCRIGGSLDLAGALVHTMSATNADVGGAVYLRCLDTDKSTMRFVSTGSVILTSMRIGGTLEMSGASLAKLNAQNASVAGSAFLNAWPGVDSIKPFTVSDTSYLMGVQVRYDLSMAGAKFEGELYAEKLYVGGSLWLTSSANVQFMLHCSAFFFGSVIEKSLKVRDFRGVSNNVINVDLSHVRVGLLDDDDGAGWGKDITLLLEGMNYSHLASSHEISKYRNWLSTLSLRTRSSIVSKKRIKWLDLQYEGRDRRKNRRQFNPDAYDRLARSFWSSGLYDESRSITMERLRVERQIAKSILARPFLAIYAGFFGSGSSPARAVATFVLGVLIGWVGTYIADYGSKTLGIEPVLILDLNTVNSLVVPSKLQNQTFVPGLLLATPEHAAIDELSCSGEIEPLLYALDVFTPALSLHQEQRCRITPQPRGAVWRYVRACYGFIGWFVTALTIITISGFARRHLR